MTSWTRRDFVRCAAAAAGASFFDLPQFARAADDPFGGMPVGVQSYSLRNFDLAEAVRHMQGLGVHFVELFEKHLSVKATDAVIADTRKLLTQAGIALRAHGVNRFTKDHEANRALFDFAKRAGIRNLSADPTPDSFDSLDKLVAEYDVRIAIHNHGPGHRYDKIADVVSAVKNHHPHIGACVDTGHFLRSQEDPVKAVHELKGRVFGVHVKDEEKREARSKNVIIGSGHLDVVGLFRALRETKFPADGAISLEYEANPQNPVDDMKQCLVVAREAIAKVVK